MGDKTKEPNSKIVPVNGQNFNVDDSRVEKALSRLKRTIGDEGWTLPKDQQIITETAVSYIQEELGPYNKKIAKLRDRCENLQDEIDGIRSNEKLTDKQKEDRMAKKEKELDKVNNQYEDAMEKVNGKANVKDLKKGELICGQFSAVTKYVLGEVGVETELEESSAQNIAGGRSRGGHAYLITKNNKHDIIDPSFKDSYKKNINGGNPDKGGYTIITDDGFAYGNGDFQKEYDRVNSKGRSDGKGVKSASAGDYYQSENNIQPEQIAENAKLAAAKIAASFDQSQLVNLSNSEVLASKTFTVSDGPVNSGHRRI